MRPTSWLADKNQRSQLGTCQASIGHRGFGNVQTVGFSFIPTTRSRREILANGKEEQNPRSKLRCIPSISKVLATPFERDSQHAEQMHVYA